MVVLVTGSAGHLGEALVRTLLARHQPVVGVDIKDSPFTHFVGSVCDRELVRGCMRGVHAIVHSATLHKPHVVTHSAQDFIDTNVTGTLVILEEARAAGVQCVVYTSTTSAFGAALTPASDEPCAWVTESVSPIPKNIYGVTKVMAESLCELFARKRGLPTVVLRTSRFFPEEDDDSAVRSQYTLENAQANEMLYRRADIEDVVTAHLAAIDKARALGFSRYIVSATTPFAPEDLGELRHNPAKVVRRLYPEFDSLYVARGWKLFPSIGRVYVNSAARKALGWQPKYDFRHVLECLRANVDFRSPLAREVGAKGYHQTTFAHGPYPV